MQMDTMTVSELRAFRSCQRKHHYRYRLRVRPAVEAQALGFGRLIHSALELYLSSRKIGLALDCVAGCEADPCDKSRAAAMLLGYHARWQADGLEVVAVEQEFTAPLVNPHSGAASRTWMLGGKIDALVKARDGRVWICEHKTSSEEIGLGSDYWQRLQLDPQISVYYVGARALGFEPAGCLYDVLRKPAQRPLLATPSEARKYKKDGTPYANQREQDETPEAFFDRCANAIGEAPEKYFQRGEIVRLEEDEKDAAADAWQTARAIRDADLTGRAPRNPDACKSYGRSCEYLPVCTKCAAIDDPILYRVAERKHEELKVA
jgi:hypothetical protein